MNRQVKAVVGRKVAMLQSGHTVSSLARDLGCSHSLVSRLISGTKVSRSKQRSIARRLGKPMETLWPRIRSN